jgi:hypothetical protein
LAGRLPREQKGGAKPPLSAAWAGADARCPSAGRPVVRPGDNAAPGRCGRAPRRYVTQRHRERGGNRAVPGYRCGNLTRLNGSIRRYPAHWIMTTGNNGKPAKPVWPTADPETAAEVRFRRNRRAMGTHLGLSPPPTTGATAGTAPKDSRAYGHRGSFHLIASCDSTALDFPRFESRGNVRDAFPVLRHESSQHRRGFG